MFTGGRGTGTITHAFLAHDQISLTLLVNAFDDGLSTGALRRFIPGMLGPSDVRKNIQRLIVGDDAQSRALRALLDYRFPLADAEASARACLAALATLNGDGVVSELKTAYADLVFR